jgi:hypothetical protein
MVGKLRTVNKFCALKCQKRYQNIIKLRDHSANIGESNQQSWRATGITLIMILLEFWYFVEEEEEEYDRRNKA